MNLGGPLERILIENGSPWKVFRSNILHSAMLTRGLRDVLGVVDTNAQVPIRETCLHIFVEFSVLLYRYESRCDKGYVLERSQVVEV